METVSPVDTSTQSPIAEKRNWGQTRLAALVALTIAAATIWWFGLRDTTSDPISVAVTGTNTCGVLIEGPDSLTRTCDVVASDLRLTGTAVVTTPLPIVNLDAIPETFVLSNDGGTWEGHVIGTVNEDGTGTIDGVLLGTGDHEGLQYRLHGEGVAGDTGATVAVSGILESIP